MERNCYCKQGQTYCGKCEICGALGHTSHFPGPVPYTGSWCDDCYIILRHGAPYPEKSNTTAA